MSRKKAFVGHLAISAVVVSALVGLFVFHLFPLPFFFEDGGWRGIRLIALVDVTIGPLLTLVVCGKGKSKAKLAFDLTVIGFLQVAALSTGLWLVFATRTESLLYADGTFYAIDAQTGASFGPAYRSIAEAERERPFHAIIDLPDDPDLRQKLRVESLQTNFPLFRKIEMLVPPGEAAVREMEGSVAKPEKVLATPEARGAMEKWLSERDAKPSAFLFVPTWCRYGKIVTVIDRRTGGIAGYLTGIEVGS